MRPKALSPTVPHAYPRATAPRCVPTPVSPLLSIMSKETTHVAVKIRLKRFGAIRNAQYRIVVMDSRTKRDGRAIEEIGLYHPKEEPSFIKLDSERAQYWLGVGAQPTEQVAAILKVTGDWQKFKGEPGAEGTLKVAAPKPDKKALYEAALAAAQNAADDSGKGSATTTRKKAEPKAEAKTEESAAVEADQAPAADAAADTTSEG
ncbi:hypothetical protein GCM10027572_09420 [Flexivirga lutea]